MKTAIALLLSVVLPALSDTLRLRSGAVIEGTFLGGTTREIEFMGDRDGAAKTYPLSGVDLLKIAAPMPPPQPAKRSSTGGGVVIPSGTVISVRLIDGIDVDTTETGQRFRASIDDPIMIGGRVVVPRGADAELQAIYVDQSGRFKGSDKITLKVTSIVVNNRLYDVATTSTQEKSKGEGKKTGRKVLGGAGLGAIIGGIAGGGSGAAIGAAIGGGGGAAVSAAGTAHLKIPPETRLQFQLAADVRID